jgi:sugar phosphate isomerase/epimerase
MTRYLLVTTLLLASLLPVFPGESEKPKALRPFVAMDNGLTRTKDLNAKAALLKELGYAGIGWRPGRTAEMLKALDAHGLKMFSTYVSVSSEAGAKLNPKLADEIKLLKGRGTFVWVLVKKGKKQDEVNTVKQLCELADLAAASGLRVALYPHAGCFVETMEDAMRVVKIAEHKNLGLSFNLCHFLKTDNEERLDEVLKAAAPHLMLVQISGADSGNTRKMGWDRLIQPLGAGTFDNAKLLAALDKIGYTGPVALQCYKIPGDDRGHLTRSMEAWRKLNGQATK